MGTPSIDYMLLPLDKFTVRDLTDALGVEASATLLNTSRRSIYTTRNTNRIGAGRVMKLIQAIQANEQECRMRLSVTRSLKATRANTAQ